MLGLAVAQTQQRMVVLAGAQAKASLNDIAQRQLRAADRAKEVLDKERSLLTRSLKLVSERRYA